MQKLGAYVCLSKVFLDLRLQKVSFCVMYDKYYIILKIRIWWFGHATRLLGASRLSESQEYGENRVGNPSSRKLPIVKSKGPEKKIF